MPKYTVTFAHMDDLQTDPSIQAGWGYIDIITDIPIETEEQKKEVAKQIGHAKGYTRVNVIKVVEMGDDDQHASE